MDWSKRMEQGMRAAALTGLVLFLLHCLVTQIRRVRKWRLDVQADFEAALQRLNIESYDFLANRNTPPGMRRPPDVYRILRDQQGRYFLYLHSGANPGVFHALTEERALLAAKLNG
jgi:hypothetical protein